MPCTCKSDRNVTGLWATDSRLNLNCFQPCKDSSFIFPLQSKLTEINGSEHQSITNGLLTRAPYSLTDSKLYARIAHLESELALAWNLTRLCNDNSCKRGDGSSLNSETHSSTGKLGQIHSHSNTGSSRQVPGRITAAPVADNLLPATPVPLLSGPQIVDQREQSTGVNGIPPTSSPVPSSAKPDRALIREHVPIRTERVPSLSIQLNAGEPIKPKLSECGHFSRIFHLSFVVFFLLCLIYLCYLLVFWHHQTELNKFSSPMHHSAASSSTPSSRTTGTGRSRIPLDSFFDKTECDMKDLGLHRQSKQQQLQQQSRTTVRHSNSQTQESLAEYKPHHRTSIPTLSDRVREPGVGHIRHTKPFESSSDSVVEASDEDLLSVVDVVRQQKPNLPASASVVPRLDSHSRSQSGKTLSRTDSARRHSELYSSNIKRRFSPNPLTRSFARSHSGLRHRSDEAHSDGGPSSSARHARDSITRTSASGASANGATNGLKRKRKVLRSMSTIVSPRHIRLRTSRPRVKSTDTLENHAEQLLDLLTISRKACAFEMDQIRSDLIRIENLIPRATRSLDNASSSCCSDSLSPTENRKNSGVTHKLSLMDTGPDSRSHSRHNATTRDTVSGRGTVRSFADTLTTVTRPSPNGHDDYSFDQLDTVTPKPPRPQRLLSHPAGRHDTQTYQRRARRLLPSTSGPEDEQASFQCDYRNGSCSQDQTPCSNQWTPDQVDDMTYGCDLPSPVRGHPHQSCATGYTSRTQHVDRKDYPGVDYKAPSLHWHESERPVTHRSSRRRSLDAQQFRALSLADREQARGTRHMETGEEDDPSTETAALLNLTEELVGLRQGLKRTRQANSGRVRFVVLHLSANS
ncbi:hypothetical protein P879_02695 [Paragonimus westermani]|uniref:Uncharacterized protein n=1 Tax=Paragonimus westermani TaxID=34504 RepID=A0A8T0DQ32_9TREM|nr:hypothetical protein P879_02695 [Paragonimus westermani]